MTANRFPAAPAFCRISAIATGRFDGDDVMISFPLVSAFGEKTDFGCVAPGFRARVDVDGRRTMPGCRCRSAFDRVLQLGIIEGRCGSVTMTESKTFRY